MNSNLNLLQESAPTVPVAKYELFTGRVSNGMLLHPLLAGFAVHFPNESHYVIRLTMFPNIPYYLCKNRDSQTQYTVFAKTFKETETNKVRFQNPIGSGKLFPDLKSHLEIRFPLLGASVFMNLFPKS